jgi:hypothetical protein
LCAFSKPKSSPPPAPPSPAAAVAKRDAEAKASKQTENRRLAKKKGGSAYLSSGFAGIADTLLGNRINKL